MSETLKLVKICMEGCFNIRKTNLEKRLALKKTERYHAKLKPHGDMEASIFD